MTSASRSRRHREAPARRRDTYTRFVNLMKFALPSLAFVIIVAALFWPDFVNTGKQASDAARDALTPTGLRNFAMESPVYVATDDRNRPYRLTATKARQVSHKATTVALDDPEAKLELTGGVQVRIKADSGRFDRDRNRLMLSGDVNVYHGSTYRFRTAEATFDMKSNTAWGGRDVFATGPDATVAAQGFLIVDKGMTVIFSGKTKATLRLNPPGPNETPDETAAEPAALPGFGR